MTPLFYEDSLGARLVEKAKESAAAAEQARAQRANRPMPARGSADLELLDDPTALDDAERGVRGGDPEDAYAEFNSDWVAVFGPSKLSGLLDVAGFAAAIVTMPLAAEAIDFVWSPYPPEMMPGPAYANDHLLDMPFTLYVHPADASAALALISEVPGSGISAGIACTHERGARAEGNRRTLAWGLVVAFLGVDVLVLLTGVAYWIYHLLRYHHL
ncbi:MAG: hypothetical protein P4L93_09320 [Coriobacteriia bacterium]|nr:hypothetical protein [Coriobacteriia bacterium]